MLHLPQLYGPRVPYNVKRTIFEYKAQTTFATFALYSEGGTWHTKKEGHYHVLFVETVAQT